MVPLTARVGTGNELMVTEAEAVLVQPLGAVAATLKLYGPAGKPDTVVMLVAPEPTGPLLPVNV